MSVERNNGAGRAVADMVQFPDLIESPLGQARVIYKTHDPSRYAPALLPWVRPYCHTCGCRVDQDGCRPYLEARAALAAAGRAL